MIKKTVYIPLTLLTICLQLVVCFGQEQSTKPKFRLLVYGLPNFERQNSENVIAQKWEIEFLPVAGCIVTQELIDSVEQHNKKVEQLIEDKYGKNWMKKFNEEVEAEYETQKKVSTLIDKLTYIMKKQAEMEKDGNGLHYIMNPVANTTNYNVFVIGWGTWNGQSEIVTYYKLLVNYKTKVVKLLSDTVTKE